MLFLLHPSAILPCVIGFSTLQCISVVYAGLRSVALGFEESPGLKKMFSMNLPENKINLLRNDFETDYRILTGEIAVERLK